MIGINDGIGNDTIASGGINGKSEMVGASSEKKGMFRTAGDADLAKIRLVTGGDCLEDCVMGESE